MWVHPPRLSRRVKLDVLRCIDSESGRRKMRWPTLKCPFCQGILRNTDVYPGRPVVCPICEAKLQPSIGQGRLSALIGLCLTVAICYFLGVSREWFLVATVLLWFPVFVIWGFIFARMVPPRFETFDSQFISLDLLHPSSTQAPEPANSSDSDSDRPAPGARSEQKPLS